MCIMEIHEDASRSTMIQAVAHNLSTVDGDLDMLRKVAIARNDDELREFCDNVQIMVHRAYADALDEFGMSLAETVQDHEGHVHVGNERTGNFLAAMDKATKEARTDETR